VGAALWVGGLIVAGVLLNVALPPHPTWMTVLGVLLPLPAAWLAARLASPRVRPPSTCSPRREPCPMQSSLLTTLLLPLALGVIMFGLGLGLSVDDFRRVARYPRAVLTGLVLQTAVLPWVALGLALLFRLPPELAVGLMLLAASRGGATANIYSHLAHGDVALNITLSAINSLLCLV